MATIPPFQTKEAYAYRVLREAILRGQYAPGDRLVMDRLSREMGISPIPLRAALQRLESERLVQITPHTGAIVAPVSFEEIGEIFQLLESFERMAFDNAAQALADGKITPPDLAPLSEALEGMEEAARMGDLEAWAQANDRFHVSAAEAAGMALLVELIRRVLDRWARLRRSYSGTLMGRLAEAQADHRKMLDLLLAGEVEKLDVLVADHNRRAAAAYLKGPGQASK